MQNVTLTPEISIKNIIDLDDWDPVISRNDKLLKIYCRRKIDYTRINV